MSLGVEHQGEWFTHQQQNNLTGSWVLVSGATGGVENPTGNDVPPPTDATSKYWVTSQTDLTSPAAENPMVDSPTLGLGGLFGWTQENQNSTKGIGGVVGLPNLGLSENTWWILYGQREILGFTECKDAHIHGHEKNWSANLLEDPYIFNPTMSDGTTGQSNEGGMIPQLILFGGDIQGAQAKVLMDSSGNITGAVVTDPGTSVVTAPLVLPPLPGELASELAERLRAAHISAPSVSISMPHHYNNFEATATISRDADVIKSTYPNLFKTPQEIRAALCDGYTDPLAQTFMVSSAYSDGIFISSVDICFANKSHYTGPPVYLEMRPTVNGFPSADHVLQDSIVSLRPSQINVADANPNPGLRSWDNPLDKTTRPVLYPNFDDENAYTRFTFKRPLYLSRNTEYAIVLRSNDSNYECWYAHVDGSLVLNEESLDNRNDGNRDTGTYAKQYQGALFRSQNGRLWTENQEQDLMFRINKCVWEADTKNPNTAVVEVRAGEKMTSDFTYDRLSVDMNFLDSPGKHTTVTSKIFMTPESTSVFGAYSTINEREFFGEDVENTVHDLPQRHILRSGKEKESSDFKIEFTLETKNPDVSPVLVTSGCKITPYKNKINDGVLAKQDINILTVGSGYTAGETAEFTVAGGGSTAQSVFTVIANAAGNLDRERMTVTSSGTGFYHSGISPATDTDVIDVTQTQGDGSGATFEILSEENIHGGNSQQRYITRAINLAPGMSARAIRVYLTARKPHGSRIHVYFRAKSESDSQTIDRKKWQLMTQTIPIAGEVATGTATREYQYDTSEIISYSTTNDGTGDTQTFDDFRTFAIKIVCQTDDTTNPPIVSDFRAIAVY